MNASRKQQIRRWARAIRRATQVLTQRELPLAAALGAMARIQRLTAQIATAAHAEYEEKEDRLQVLTEVEPARQGEIEESAHYIHEALDDLNSDSSLTGVLTAVEELQRHVRDIAAQVLADYEEETG